MKILAIPIAATALKVILDPTARRKSMNAIPLPAKTEPSAKTWLEPINVNVLKDSKVKTAS